MSTATVIPFVSEPSDSAAAMERYREAYRVAETTTGFAETAKLAGIFVGGVFVVSASIGGQLERTWHAFPGAALALLACAGIAFLAGHLWEKIFQAQGRRLQMSVDVAVNSSPFLSNAQRATLMSIRQERASVVSIETKVS